MLMTSQVSVEGVINRSERRSNIKNRIVQKLGSDSQFRWEEPKMTRALGGVRRSVLPHGSQSSAFGADSAACCL